MSNFALAVCLILAVSIVAQPARIVISSANAFTLRLLIPDWSLIYTTHHASSINDTFRNRLLNLNHRHKKMYRAMYPGLLNQCKTAAQRRAL